MPRIGHDEPEEEEGYLMNVVLASVVAAEGAQVEGGHLPPFVFGGVALGCLVLLLFVTWMLNVDR
ncbi:MAG: hypothetical protein ACYYNF_05705 [Actinomycetes bacterium]